MNESTQTSGSEPDASFVSATGEQNNSVFDSSLASSLNETVVMDTGAPPPAVSNDPVVLLASMLDQMRRDAHVREQEFARREREYARREEESKREAEQREAEAARRETLLMERLESLSSGRSDGRQSGEKPPVFDLSKDKSKFSTWKPKWMYFQTSSGIETIQSSARKQEQKRAALQRAFSDDTIQWVSNQGFSDEEMRDADFIVNKLEAYIKGCLLYTSPSPRD